MVEDDKLTQFLSDLLPWQILCGFLSKMVKSDLTIALGDDLYQPKNMIFVNCWFKHVVVELSKYCCQVEGPENGNSDCIFDLTMNISDSDEAMDKLKWSTLQTRQESHIFKFVKKCIKGHCPQFFKNYFTFNNVIHNRTTRQSNMLHLPRVRTETAKRSFYYNGCKIFNRLNS